MAEELGDKGVGVHSGDNSIKIYIARLDDQPNEKYFTKDFKPYVIGKIIYGKKNIVLNGKIKW